MRDISRESVPTAILIPRLDVAQEFLVERRRVAMGPIGGAVKPHIVRMNVHQGHPAMFGDPIKFLFPFIDGSFAQQEEQRRVLGIAEPAERVAGL